MLLLPIPTSWLPYCKIIKNSKTEADTLVLTNALVANEEQANSQQVLLDTVVITRKDLCPHILDLVTSRSDLVLSFVVPNNSLVHFIFGNTTSSWLGFCVPGLFGIEIGSRSLMVVTSSTGLLAASSGTLKLFWYVKQKTVPETYLKSNG